jgi:hypothetical protein
MHSQMKLKNIHKLTSYPTRFSNLSLMSSSLYAFVMRFANSSHPMQAIIDVQTNKKNVNKIPIQRNQLTVYSAMFPIQRLSIVSE